MFNDTQHQIKSTFGRQPNGNLVQGNAQVILAMIIFF